MFSATTDGESFFIVIMIMGFSDYLFADKSELEKKSSCTDCHLGSNMVPVCVSLWSRQNRDQRSVQLAAD